jgi:AcrR family transcriptional regulator
VPKEATRVDVDELVERLVARPRTDGTDARILGAAGEVLLRDGLDGLEVDDVAAHSGVGRSTVYRRFGDRNGLISAALAHEARRLFSVLADAVADEPTPVDQVVTAFCAGLRLARATGLTDLVRTDPLLLRLLTVDAEPVIAAARDQLTLLALVQDPARDATDASRSAEVLVRLALSFVVTPGSALDLDGDGCEDVVRRHLAPLVDPQPSSVPIVVADPTS